MPGKMSAEQERCWSEAKKTAAKAGKTGDWPYIQGVYKHMMANKGKPHAEPKGEHDKRGEQMESVKERNREMLAMAAKRRLHKMRG